MNRAGVSGDINGNEIPCALRNLILRDYIATRTRYGFSGDLEFRPNDDNRFFMRGMYNQRDDYEYRQRLDVVPEDGDIVDGTHIHVSSIHT